MRAHHSSYSSLASDTITIAYSLEGSRKIGYGKETLVAVSPVLEIVISSGLSVTGSPITSLVGVPSSTVLISTLTGLLLLSLLAKNRSTAVKYAPLVSSFAPVGSEVVLILPPTVND